MSEFFNVATSSEALDLLLARMTHALPGEMIDTPSALGRVLAIDVTSPEDLPAFARSTMDGYAVQAASTFGASDTLPAYLRVVGEVPMGAQPGVAVGRGEAALIHTGGMLPHGADAVVMVELTQPSREGEVEVLRAVGVGENTLQIGEDVARDAVVLPAGQVLRPQDIGGLLALGITRVDVKRRPLVAVLSTGDEVVPPDQVPDIGQVRDINAYTVSALVERLGGVARRYGIVPDNRAALDEAARRAIDECDLLVLSAGSAVSVRDMTHDVLDNLDPQGGVLVHGVAVKPGKPTLLGTAFGKAVVGLPGNPVSAMVVADLLLPGIIHAMLGQRSPDERVVLARLTHSLNSTTGREDYVPVRLDTRDGELWAEPLFGKSNLIFTLVRADGAAMIPLNSNGIESGGWARIRLF